MTLTENIVQWILGALIVISSLGIIAAKKPVHASLYFLLTLLSLAGLYLQLSAEFIAAMQILVYAGAILVLFMFVIILFQDAYLEIDRLKSNSNKILLSVAGTSFIITIFCLSSMFSQYPLAAHPASNGFGTVQSLGKALYVDFFFPFEAVILLFLVAIVGSLYIGRKVNV